MQWTADPAGGFSTADPSRLPAPMVEGELGPENVNVAAQRRDPESLFNWMKLLVLRYRECPEFSWGSCTILETGVRSVFAHRSDYEDGTVAAVHNFAPDPVRVHLAVAGSAVGVRAIGLLETGAETSTADVREDGLLSLDLAPYGCRWLRIVHPGDRYLV